MLPAAVRSASASTTLSFSELNTVLVVLLCTLRGRRHQRPRNTRYRAGATPYPNRTFTGWIAPASPGAREQVLMPDPRPTAAFSPPLMQIKDPLHAKAYHSKNFSQSSRYVLKKNAGKAHLMNCF